MNRNRKTGIILILIGVCIPLATLPFLSGYSKEKSFTDNLYSVGIQIAKEKPAATSSAGSVTNPGPTEKRKITWDDVMPKRIQFRFILALAVILIFVGIVKVEGSRRKQDDSGESAI